VALHGELDVTGATVAEASITDLVIPGQSLIIDMSALDFIDCASLGALLRVQMLARPVGGNLVLAAPQPHARWLLVLTGKDAAFWVHASVAAAVASIGSRRTRSRPVAVWGQVAAHAAAHGRRASVADVCAVAVSFAQLSGAWAPPQTSRPSAPPAATRTGERRAVSRAPRSTPVPVSGLAGRRGAR